MTLEKLAKGLPNGLHDSRVSRITIDYNQRKLILDIDVWGDMDSDAREQREPHKRGQVLISGLVFAAMEPPDPRYPFSTATRLTIAGCDMSKNLSAELKNSLSADTFFRSLWVNEWNAFIHIAAKNAELKWLDDSGTLDSALEARS
jgi:hypothetical protein